MFFNRFLLLLALLTFSCCAFSQQDSLAYFRSRNQLARYLRFNWDRQNALEDPNPALNILDRTIKKLWRSPKNALEAEELLWVQLSRADYLFQLGKVLESVQAYEEALRWHKRYHFPEMVEYLYKPLIAHYTRLGENEKARVLYDQALKEADRESLPGLYNNLGVTYWNEGRNAEALVYFAKGFQIEGLSPAKKGLLYLSEARSRFELGQNPQASEVLKKALHTLESIPQKDQDILDYLAGAYTLQGAMYRQSSAYALAEKALTRALQLARKVYGTQHREYGKINLEYANLFLQKGQNEQAIYFFDAALTAVIPRYKPISPTSLPDRKHLYEENTLYEALAGKAEALAGLYKKNRSLHFLEVAFHCHQLAQQVELSLRNTLQFESSKLTLLAYSRKRMEAAIAVAFDLYTQTNHTRILQDAWTMLEQNKAAVLLEAVQENCIKQALNTGDTLLLKEISLKKQIAWFENAALSADNNSLNKNYLRQANQIRDALADVKKQLAKKYPAYAHYKDQLAALEFDKIRSRLLNPQEGMVLEFFAGADQTYLFGLSAAGHFNWVKIGSSKTLHAEVGQILHLIQDKTGGDVQHYQQIAWQLFSKLVPKRLIPSSCKSIVLIPDAWLSGLPFEALVSSEKTVARWSQVPFWCRQVQLQYGYSLGILLSQQDLQTPKKACLLAIAPEFTQKQRGLAPLRNSKVEVEQIKGIAKRVFFNSDASWQNFSENAPKYNILHLATHASADTLRNTAGIEFYERRASLSDIYALSLQADLVCLSACQSGLGEWREGEGVMSLARAFAYAGTKGLVATLWSVNEAASSTLFDSFYAHLHSGQRKSVALNRAKLDYLDNQDIPVFQKAPYYWAALTYIGEDSAIAMQAPFPVAWVLGGIALLGLVAYIYLKRRKTTKTDKGSKTISNE